jgi:hypothetical protein
MLRRVLTVEAREDNMKDSGEGSQGLKKESRIDDVGAKKIDFGTGEAKATPAPKSASRKRPDSEPCYPEFENPGNSSHAMRISSKDNGGPTSGPSGSQSGM